MKCITIGSVLIIAGLTLSLAARAQAPPAQLQAVPQGSPIPRVLPPTPAPPTAAPLALPPAAPATALPNQPVRVTSVTVEGVTVYPLPAIMALTGGLTGPAVPPASIDGARQAILQRYRADGYVLSSVSVALDARSGRLRFVVAEGRIAAVKLDGDIGPAGVQVLRFLDHLTEPPVIDAATLERYVLLAGEVPGVTLHAVLQPAPDDPGALMLVAQVSRQAVSALATADNRAWVNVGPIEGLVLADLNSFTSFGEKTELTLYHAFPNTATYGQGAIETFLGGSGLKLRVYGGSGVAVPTGPLRAENYSGATTLFGAQLSYPVILASRQLLNTYVDVDAADSVVNLGLLGAPATQFSSDAVRALRLGASYAISDHLLGAERSAVTVAAVRVSQGLSILGATANGAASLPRVGEQNSFTKVDFRLTRTQTLFTPWQGATVALKGLLVGQYSGDVLPPTEEFFLGGMEYARGYYAGQVVGDSALAATAELQLNTTIGLGRLGWTHEIPVQFYTFYDWGEAWANHANGPGAHLGSVGGGARMQLARWAELDLEGVARLNRYPNGTGPGVSALYGGAFYWRVVVRY